APLVPEGEARMSSKPLREILGAYHVALFPNWKEIVTEQCRRLETSGLLHKTKRLLVGTVGDPAEDVTLIRSLLGAKAELRFLGPLDAFEFPTLQWLHGEACTSDFACWYMHTKGVSNMSPAAAACRLEMEAQILDNHE